MALLPAVQLVVVLAGAPWTVAAARPSPAETLRAAVEFFEAFDDGRAEMKFRALLAQSPPAPIAAQAHVYLGLIALNAGDAEAGKAEFEKAIRTDALVELPTGQSPKSRLAFGQVRNEMLAAVEARPPPKPPAAQAVPAEATLPPPVVFEEAPPPSSHTAAWILGGATLVLAGLAVYGGVQVLNYNSMVDSGNSAVGAGTGGNPGYTLDQLNSARGPASFWAVGWPVALGLAAASLTGAALTW